MPFIYADDTALLAKGRDITSINEKLQSDFDVLKKGFKTNNLKLNADKSQVVVFSSKRSSIKTEKIVLTDNDIEIEMVDTVK